MVHQVLEKTFGRAALAKMHRLTATGPVTTNLDSELNEMEALFCGAYLTVCGEIGLEPVSLAQLGLAGEPAADRTQFNKWLGRMNDDPDVAQDCRMMVPVFYDPQRQKIKVWAFLGWAKRIMDVDFDREPAASIFDSSGAPVRLNPPELQFVGTHRELTYPVTAEVYVTQLLDRDEFRRLCDHYANPAKILEQLQK